MTRDWRIAMTASLHQSPCRQSREGDVPCGVMGAIRDEVPYVEEQPHGRELRRGGYMTNLILIRLSGMGDHADGVGTNSVPPMTMIYPPAIPACVQLTWACFTCTAHPGPQPSHPDPA
jgi:hypothetical protein